MQFTFMHCANPILSTSGMFHCWLKKLLHCKCNIGFLSMFVWILWSCWKDTAYRKEFFTRQ